MKVSADSCFDEDQVWPPGFRFHPTDEELVLYYLKRKICRKRLKLDIIRETDVYKFDPEELPGQSILKTGDRQWFFFSPRDRKYPNGGRSSRATRHGYWKATGKDRNITYCSRNAGVKKTLVFYKGRAPKGERTDWVMHEYTLYDEELKRCQNIKDHYVLYKIFKKSGPGPKNGEQYGAPFNEEDWADDEIKPISSLPTLNNLNEVSPIDGLGINGHFQPSLGFEEFLQQTENVPALPQPQPAVRNNSLPQVFDVEETRGTLLDPSSREIVSPESNWNLPPHGQQNPEHKNFDFQLSPTSNLESFEAPEVTSLSDQSEQTPIVFEEGFLEMDDLLGPEPIVSKSEEHGENLQFDEFDGLGEIELYHDAAMFVQDMGGFIDQGTLSQEQSNVYGDGFMNQENFSMQTQSNAISDYQPQFYPAVDEQSYQFQFDSTGNELQHQSVEDQNSLWMHDLLADELTPEASFSETPSQSTPVYLLADEFTPEESFSGTPSQYTPGLTTDGTPPQRTKQEVGGTSSLSSALWSFVESIPTTPAAAAESPLVNLAFERMSSFNRLKRSIRSTNAAAAPAGTEAATVRSAGANRGFFFMSVLGALCAILWLLVGSVRVLGRTIFS